MLSTYSKSIVRVAVSWSLSPDAPELPSFPSRLALKYSAFRAPRKRILASSKALLQEEIPSDNGEVAITVTKKVPVIVNVTMTITVKVPVISKVTIKVLVVAKVTIKVPETAKITSKITVKVPVIAKVTIRATEKVPVIAKVTIKVTFTVPDSKGNDKGTGYNIGNDISATVEVPVTSKVTIKVTVAETVTPRQVSDNRKADGSSIGNARGNGNDARSSNRCKAAEVTTMTTLSSSNARLIDVAGTQR